MSLIRNKIIAYIAIKAIIKIYKDKVAVKNVNLVQYPK
jgi:hypothetical protein